MTTIYPPLTPFQQQRLNTLGPPWRNLAMGSRIAGLESSDDTNSAAIAALAGGSSPFDSIVYTDQPTSEETLRINVSGGDDLYFQFLDEGDPVTDDTYISVLIGATAADTYAAFCEAINRTAEPNGIQNVAEDAQALYLGTQPLLAIQGTGVVYVFQADAAGGTPITGAGSNIAFTSTLSNATLLRTNMNLSPAVQNSARAAIQRTISSADLALTQPVQIAVPFLPTGALLQVVDAGGRLKWGADFKWAAGTAVAGQNFLNVTFNASVAADPGVLTAPGDVTPVASTDVGTYFAGPARPVRVLAVQITADTAPAGGTLVYNGIKTAANGTETVLASAVNVAGISAHTPTAITYDDAALPQSLAATEKLQHQLSGGAGLSAPTAATFTTYYTVLVEAGDVLVGDVWGA